MNLDQVTIHGNQIYLLFQPGSSGSLTNSSITSDYFYNLAITVKDSSPTISGNTIISQNGIKVEGNSLITPSNPVIQDNDFTTSSFGIQVLGDSTSGTISGNSFTSPEENDAYTGITVDGDASPTITNNTFADRSLVDDFAVQMLVSPLSTASLTNNTICATGQDVPILVDIDYFATSAQAEISGNTLNCGWARGIGLRGTTEDDGALADLEGQSNFFLYGSIHISQGDNFSISDRMIDGGGRTITAIGSLDISQATLENVGLNASTGGHLVVNQTEISGRSSSISYSTDATGSVTNSDLTALSGTGVSINNASSVTISGNTFWGMSTGVSIWDNSLSDLSTISIDSNVFNCVTTAINLNGSIDSQVSNNQFVESTVGLQVWSGAPQVTLTDNTFTRNDRSLHFNDDDSLFSWIPGNFTDSRFIGTGGQNRIGLPHTVNRSGVLPEMPMAYKATSNIQLSNNAQMTVPPGVTISFPSGRLLRVLDTARLVAVGTEEFPVVFTGIPGQNAWGGLDLRDDSVLTHCVVEFANTNVSISNGGVPIDHCRISDGQVGLTTTGETASAVITNSSVVLNALDGIRRVAGDVSIEQSSIFSNFELGINNQDEATEISAEYNYWGHDSGPLDLSDDTATGGYHNPDGQGQRLSDGVDYDPWIVLSPTQTGTIIATGGDGQSGPVGSTLPIPLEVEILSLLENPIEGVEVIFSVTSGDASIVETQPVLSDASGMASSQLKLGLNAGLVEISVTARDVNSPMATFGAEGTGTLAIESQVINFTVIPGEIGQLGDVNGDGHVNNHDAVLVSALAVGELDEYDAPVVFYDSADVNADGRVDSGDAMLLHAVQVRLLGY